MNNLLLSASKRPDCVMAVFPHQNSGVWTAPFHTNVLRNFSNLFLYSDIPNIIQELGSDDFSISITFRQLAFDDNPNKMIILGSETDTGLKIRFQKNSSKLLVIYNNLFENDSYNSHEFDTNFNYKNTIKLERINKTLNIYQDGVLVYSITNDGEPTTIGNISSRCYSYFKGNIFDFSIVNLTSNKTVYQAPYNVLYSGDYPKNILEDLGTILWNDFAEVYDNINYDWECSIKFSGSFILNSFNNNQIFKTSDMLGWTISWERYYLLIRYRNAQGTDIIYYNFSLENPSINNCEIKFGLLNNKLFIKVYSNNIFVESVEVNYTDDFANYRTDKYLHYSSFNGSIEHLKITNLTDDNIVYSAPYSRLYNIKNQLPYPSNKEIDYFYNHKSHEQLRDYDFSKPFRLEIEGYKSPDNNTYSTVFGRSAVVPFWVEFNEDNTHLTYKFNCQDGTTLQKNYKLESDYFKIIIDYQSELNVYCNDSLILTSDKMLISTFGQSDLYPVTACGKNIDIKLFNYEQQKYVFKYPSWEEKHSLLKFNNVQVKDNNFLNILSGNSYIEVLQPDWYDDLTEFTIITKYKVYINNINYTDADYVSPVLLQGDLIGKSTAIRSKKSADGTTHISEFLIDCAYSNNTRYSYTLPINTYTITDDTYYIDDVVAITCDIKNKKLISFINGVQKYTIKLGASITQLYKNPIKQILLNYNPSALNKFFNLQTDYVMVFNSVLSHEEIKRLSFQGVYKNYLNKYFNWKQFFEILKTIKTDDFSFEFSFNIFNYIPGSFIFQNSSKDTSFFGVWSNKSGSINNLTSSFKITENTINSRSLMYDVDIRGYHKYKIQRLNGEIDIWFDGILKFHDFDQINTDLSLMQHVPYSNYDCNILDGTLVNLTTNQLLWKPSQYDIMN